LSGISGLILSIFLLAIGGGVGYYIHKVQAKTKLSNAQQQAEETLVEAKKEAENLKRAMLVEAKDELYKARNDFEKETKDRRVELQNLEKRILQKETI